MIKKTWTFFLGGLSFLGIVLIFQNCTQFPAQTAVSRFGEDIFPYTFDFDQISFLSCAGVKGAVNPNDYYTFQVQATKPPYGVRLSEEFMAKTKFFTETQREELLSNNQYAGAILQFAIRDNQQLSSSVLESVSPGSQKASYILFPLSSPPLSTLLAQGQTVFSLPGSASSYRFKGTLNFSSSDVASFESSLVQGALQNSQTHTLAITYNDGSSDVGALSPSFGPEQNIKVFGTGIVTTFAQTLSETSNSPFYRKLIRIYTKDLLSGKPLTSSSQWSCVNALVFPQGDGRCAGVPSNTLDKVALQKALPSPQWTIGLYNNQLCVKEPRTDTLNGSCYRQPPKQNNYQPPLMVLPGSGSCKAGYNCPEYLSVCYRP
ncbi:MAG: hypothetical protein D6797_01510 [Bdellovibrio sp.]|nr:MAG: hypothetical protein D6797_01510 [Bdellovibrio sp.]